MASRRLLEQMDDAWNGFTASYAGLTEAELLEPGVIGNWSVRDIIAHVTWWEEEALHHLPTILAGGRAPRYSTTYGGVDAFNALKTREKAGLSLAEVLREQTDVHERLVRYVMTISESELARAGRFRRRLRLDAYGHYPKHAVAIQRWRSARGGAGG